METAKSRDSRSASNSREHNYSYDRPDYEGHRVQRKPRFNDRGGREPWKRSGRQSGFGGGNWRNGRENQRSKSGKKNASNRDSTKDQEVKPVIFDLSSGRSKLELNDWFKNAAPSKLRRSDGVECIYILSEKITEKDKKDLFEFYEGVVGLRQEWSEIHDDPSIEVTFETFKKLAEKHDCKHGKWILTAGQIDDLWQNLALAFAYDKFPEETIAMKVTPVNESEPSGSRNHMLCFINRNMTNENEIVGVERAIRNVGFRADLQYKPTIYTELGIYRNNKFGIRPTVYTSVRKNVDGESGFEVTNLAREEWVYRYTPDTAIQMSFEGDANIKNSNENLVEAPTKLEDVQAKMERLREAMESVEEAIKALKNDEETVKSNTKQQGKEKKKKSKNKKGNDIAENVDATIDIKKMIQEVVDKIDDKNVEVNDLEIKEDFYPKKDEQNVDERNDVKMSKDIVDDKKKSNDEKKSEEKDSDDKKEGMETADGAKVEENEGKEEAGEGKNEVKGDVITEEEKNKVDEAQA